MESTRLELTSGSFKDKIFSIMNQQPADKIFKMSHRILQKTVNTTHSPFRYYSQDNEIIDETKLSALESSSGLIHFKSLQDKLGQKITFSSGQQHKNPIKSNERSEIKSGNKSEFLNKSNEKKVKFLKSQPQQYFNSNIKSRKKYKSKKKYSNRSQFLKSHTSLNLKNKSNNHQNSIHKHFSNTNLHKKKKKNHSIIIQTNLKQPYSLIHQSLRQQTDKETQKKNYLLNTLKKMESVRKNLTQTFQRFDRQNHHKIQRPPEGLSLQISQKNKAKEKSKSNLTIISDIISEEVDSRTNYQINSSKENKLNKCKSKSFKKQSSNKSLSQLMFHKKTPSKNNRLRSDQSFSQKLSGYKRKRLIQRSLLKKILKSCRNPSKWQTLLQNDLVSIHFRIVKHKLVEIQMHSGRDLDKLAVQLYKGPFKCQSLKEDYSNVRKKQIITLLSSVRGINLFSEELNLFDLPKLIISIETNLQDNPITFRKQVDLPYVWLMLAEKSKTQKITSSSKKENQLLNRVKTRSTLHNLELSKKHQLNLTPIFSFCQLQINQKTLGIKNQGKKPSKSSIYKTPSTANFKIVPQNYFVYCFQIQEQEFKLFVRIYNDKTPLKGSNQTSYDLQLEGKGESLMEKMLLFLESLE